MKIYGIAQCDSVKAVRKQLADRDYVFIDFKTAPPDAQTIARWHAAVGDALLNRQSRTWREHKDLFAQAEKDGNAALFAALAAHPLALKRPIVESERGVAVGKNALQTLAEK